MPDPGALFQEFSDRFSGRYFGRYKGQVVETDDPAQLYRVRCTFPQHFGNHKDLLTWAFPTSNGIAHIPPVGTIVILSFIDGDITEPLYEWGPWSKRADGTSGLPNHCVGNADITDQGSKGTNGIPKSTFKGEYGKVTSWDSPGGHRLEFDDTPGHSRIQIYHKSGTHIEILDDGTIVECAEGSKIESSKGDKTEYVYGSSKSSITGDVEQHISGNLKQTVLGDAEIFWMGHQKFNIRKLDIKTTGGQSLTSGGGLFIATDANKTESIGGSRSSTVSASDSHVIMGPYTCMVPNATNVNPLLYSMLMHAFNGQAGFKCTDPTGKASGGYLNISYAPAILKLFAGNPIDEFLQMPGGGSPTGSGLVLDGTGAGTVLHSMGNILLVAKAMTQILAPVVQLGLAAVHQAMLGEIAALLFDTHTHVCAGIPTTIPVAPIMAQTALSKSVFVGT